MNKDFTAAADPKILKWLERAFGAEDDVLREIRERSKSAGLPMIQVGPMDGLHLEVLTRALGARKAVEIGTLGGYSGVRILRGLTSDGILYTFEMDAKHAEVARESFKRAGFGERARIQVGPALKNLASIEGQGPFDLVFIDADKVSYPAYLEWAERNLRVGGAVLGDNTLAFGMLADETYESPEDEATVRAIREFNTRAATGGRFRATMLPTGEGLTLAVKIR